MASAGLTASYLIEGDKIAVEITGPRLIEVLGQHPARINGLGWFFVHTHRQSGVEPAPSKLDEKATMTYAWLGKILGSPLVDSIMLSADLSKHFSFREKLPGMLAPAVELQPGITIGSAPAPVAVSAR